MSATCPFAYTGAGGGGGFGAMVSATLPVTPEQALYVEVGSPRLQLSTSSIGFGTQSQATLSGSQTVTLTNAGDGPLTVSGVTFAGSDPGDFVLSSNGCMGAVAPGASCTLGVSFAPQAQGARSATLQIASNDSNGVASVTLSGTGGQLPQGATGAAGPQGATGVAGSQGATGPAGPRGTTGKVELITCTTVTKKVKGRLRKTQRCRGKFISGTVKFTINGNVTRAILSRGHTVYAAGVNVSLGRGQSQLVLNDLRPLRAGSYRLTTRKGHRHRAVRRTISIT